MSTIAAWWPNPRVKRPRTLVIVIHDMEVPLEKGVAETVARSWHTSASPQASVHKIVDPGGVVRCLGDGDLAWGAGPHANEIGLHLELAGYARQTREEWLAPEALGMLRLAAVQCAAWAAKYRIPVKRLTIDELRRTYLTSGYRGFVGHVDVSAAWPGDTDHTDPGGGFPWDVFLELVQAALARQDKAHPVLLGTATKTAAAVGLTVLGLFGGLVAGVHHSTPARPAVHATPSPSPKCTP